MDDRDWQWERGTLTASLPSIPPSLPSRLLYSCLCPSYPFLPLLLPLSPLSLPCVHTAAAVCEHAWRGTIDVGVNSAKSAAATLLPQITFARALITLMQPRQIWLMLRAS